MADRSNVQTKLFLPPQQNVLYSRTVTPRLNGTKLNLPDGQASVNIQGRESLAIYPANTIPSTYLQGPSSLTISIPPVNQYLKHVNPEFTVTNNGASAVQLKPVPLWCDSITISGNHGNTVIQQFSSQAGMYLGEVSNQTDEPLKALSAVLNIDPEELSAPGVSGLLAAGESKKYYLSMQAAFWENILVEVVIIDSETDRCAGRNRPAGVLRFAVPQSG